MNKQPQLGKEKVNSRRKSMFALVFLSVCIIGLTYSWFHLKAYEGGAIEYRKDMQITSTLGNVTNYIGSVGENNEITYKELPDKMKVIWSQEEVKEEPMEESKAFDAKNLYPGQRLYFKTDIKNEKEKPLNLSLYLTGIEYSSVLNSAIRFVETQPSSLSKCYEDDAVEAKKDNEDICKLSSARISDNLTVDAGKTESVYWYIEIIGDKAGNECENSWITISHMQLLQGSNRK